MPTPERTLLTTATPRRSKVISRSEETISMTNNNRPRLLPVGRAIYFTSYRLNTASDVARRSAPFQVIQTLQCIFQIHLQRS